MSDVARLAGVNRVTASVALNGSSKTGTRVSDATRQRVVDAAHELGYTPSAIALALRQQRTNIIGYYAGYEGLDARDPFTATILNGLQHACHRHQQDLLLLGSYRRSSVDEVYSSLVSGKIDGCILLPTPNSPVLDYLTDSHLPLVAISNPKPGIPSVTVDDLTGSRLLVEYLAKQGHERIWYRADVPGHVSTIRRQQAFLEFARQMNLEVMVTTDSKYGDLLDSDLPYISGDRTLRPTAIVCWTDLHAYNLTDDLKIRGLRVPDDMAVVGFDGLPFKIRPAYELTTIRAPWHDAVELAVDLLMKIIEGDASEIDPETILPVELVTGDTA